MPTYTKIELEEALKAMESLVKKSEKAQSTLKEGTAQHTTITRRLKAFKMAHAIILEKLVEDGKK
ncbi:MAG: hypothetical protein A2102_04540 [Tenericutes bacterium GWF2_38_8]|nr:MAG: hypothetical protein A2102_04540 [Tenericutes bacterium GWF2_38_8]HBG32637.1 hypothetical protein [Acholeplasmataceae bacterium]HCB67208.1 hypothetical protein [Acholeplasmataceae bacterium]